MIKKAALFLAVLTMLIILVSCGGADDNEILSALGELSPKARELYGIVYGDALAHGEVEDDGYARVSEDAEYQSIDEIKAALSEVFTPEYCEIIYNTAFSGVAVEEGEISSKFGEDETGLYVNPSVTEGFAEPREFDITAAEVVKKNRFAAVVRIPHNDGDIEVTLTFIDGKWLIDSPMF